MESNGIIWGLWHAPLTIIGHNYGLDYPGFPYMGILAMCLFCTVIGILFSYVTIKTGSCLPAALAHGALNGFASAPSLFTKAGFGNPIIGPLSTGIIGGIGWGDVGDGYRKAPLKTPQQIRPHPSFASAPPAPFEKTISPL